MISRLLHRARRLDLFLKERIGFPIHLLLSIGIVGEIILNTRELTKKFAAESTGIHLGLAFSIIVGILLLIHQLSEISESIDRRRDTRAARG